MNNSSKVGLADSLDSGFDLTLNGAVSGTVTGVLASKELTMMVSSASVSTTDSSMVKTPTIAFPITNSVVDNANPFRTSAFATSSVLESKHVSTDWEISANVDMVSTVANELYGKSVAVSANGVVMAIGASFYTGAAGTQGGVYIYDWNGSAWIQRGSVLVAGDAGAGDFYGSSVSLSADGSVLAIGAPGWDGGPAGTNQGGVYVYDWNGSSWIQRDSVLIDTAGAVSDAYGTSVSLSNDGMMLVVGAPNKGNAGINQGSVFTYINDVGVWVVKNVVLVAADAADNSNFGSAVTIAADGRSLVVGAPNWDGTVVDQGKVYLYEMIGGIWVPRVNGTIVDGTPILSDNFGSAIACTNDLSRIMIGTINKDGSAADTGQVVVYEWNGTTWVIVDTIVSNDPVLNGHFGQSIACDEYGELLLIGAELFSTTTTTMGGSSSYRLLHTGNYDNTLVMDSSHYNDATDLTSHLPLELVVGNQYKLRVRYNALGYASMWSDTVSFTANVVGMTVNKPSVIVPSDSTIGVTVWPLYVSSDYSSNDPTDSHLLTVWSISTDKAHSNPEIHTNNASSVGGLLSLFTTANLQYGTDYWVKVRHVNSLGMSSAWSDDVTFTTLQRNQSLVPIGGGNTIVTDFITASDAGAGDFFGYGATISADGSVLVVGAYGWDGTATDQGGVYVYDWVSTAWIQRGAMLTASDAGASDFFGVSTALSADGSVLVVGAHSWGGPAGTNQGGVYIYDWDGSSWIQRGSVLTASDAGDSDFFGIDTALSADGSVLVVGAHGWDGSAGTDQGGVYIYDWVSTAWIQRGGVLTASDAGTSDQYGVSAALSADGSVLVVGARFWDGAAGADQGAVYIYDWNGSAWAQRGGVLIASDAGAGDQYGIGTALSADGSVLVVGAYAWDGTFTDQGGVYVYDWVSTTWVQRGSVLTASDAGTSDFFGRSVSLNTDGSVLVVGAYAWDGSGGADQGGVYVIV